MNYYEPRQVDPTSDRADAGLWRYTCRNDDRVWPVGYCAEGCPGHDTPEQAREHQRRYVLEHRLKLDGQYAGMKLQCEAPTNVRTVDASALLEGGVITGAQVKDSPAKPCGEYTDRFAEVDHGQSWTLCDEHRTREVVEALYHQGDAISS